MADAIVGYTLYVGTSDYPRHWVVRRWEVVKECLHADNGVRLFSSRAEAIAVFGHMHWISRSVEDDPVIVGVWLE